MSFSHLPSQMSVGKCRHLICHQQQSTPLFFLNHHHLWCPPTPHHHIHPWPPLPTTLVDCPQQPRHTTTQQQPCNATSSLSGCFWPPWWVNNHLTPPLLTIWQWCGKQMDVDSSHHGRHNKQPPRPPMPRCHITDSDVATKQRTAMMDRQCSDMNDNEGPPTTQTAMRAHHHHWWTATRTTTTMHQQRWAPSTSTHPMQPGQGWQWQRGCPTTPTDNTQLGDDNMREDDDKGHVPLAFYIPLPFIPLPFTIPLPPSSPIPSSPIPSSPFPSSPIPSSPIPSSPFPSPSPFPSSPFPLPSPSL